MKTKKTKIREDEQGLFIKFEGEAYRPEVTEYFECDYDSANTTGLKAGQTVLVHRETDYETEGTFGFSRDGLHHLWFSHGKLKGGVKPEDCRSPVVEEKHPEDEYSLPINSENMAVYLVYEMVSNYPNKTAEEIYEQLEDDEEHLTLGEVRHILAALGSLGFIKLEQRTEYKVCE